MANAGRCVFDHACGQYLSDEEVEEKVDVRD